MTPSQRRVFDVVVAEFDLPFSVRDAQDVVGRRHRMSEHTIKKAIETLVADGDLEHSGSDGVRKLWWWVGEPIGRTQEVA